MEHIETHQNNVGLVVSRYFKAEGILQQEVANRLGIKKQTVANHMQLPVFNETVATKYADEFDFNLVFLLTGKGRLEKGSAAIRSIKRENAALKRKVAEQAAEIERMKSVIAK